MQQAVYKRTSVVNKSVFIVTAVLTLAAGAETADLYKVLISSHSEAAALSATGVDALLKVHDGYLVLIPPGEEHCLAESGLRFRLIATDVAREHLALDVRLDSLNRERFQPVYEEGRLRLLRVDPAEIRDSGDDLALAPVLTHSLRILYRESPRLNQATVADLMDLDSLISLVSFDSCRSYVERLEAFNGRYAGTDSNYASRDWIVNKLNEFGYDSVLLDSFIGVENWGTGDSVECQNVVGYKVGSLCPHYQIVVGAHRDSWPLESPGADDDATGTAGVLEIARVLSGIDTRMTFVFILFDAEEFGLYGSWHYANEAGLRGDSIALMLNMDMIGYYENSADADVFYTASGACGELWRDLADSLSQIGITAWLDTPAVWDAQPFEQNGYEALTLHEYITMPFVHTPHDSSVYLDFDYMARMVMATLATAYVADGTYPVSPLWFSCPEGAPKMLFPCASTTVQLAVEGHGQGEIVPGSGLLHYSVNDGPVASLPMAEMGVGLYEAVIPPQSCFSKVLYHFSVEEVSAGPLYYPDTANPFKATVATRTEIVFEDDFNTDKGWQVSGDAMHGHWERADPDYTTAFWGAPAYDYDFSGYCYLTEYEKLMNVDNGTTRLYSPWIHISGAGAQVSYARWYANYYPVGEPNADTFKVFIRKMTMFTLAETVGPVQQASGGWYEHSFWVSDFFSSADSIQLRFDASDLGEPSHVEAALDAFKVFQYTCAPLILTDTLPDWTVDIPYSQQLEAVGCCSLHTWSDKFNDLSGTALTLSSAGVLSGTPVLVGEISFTAVATDDSSQTDEKLLSLQINPALEVTTDSLPEGSVGDAYEEQLTATGGTGTLTWADRDGDLAGTGLILSADGLLSGVPVDTATISFAARVEDAVGASDEKPLTLVVGPAYVCGDVDDSGGIPNVADLTYLVDYLFFEGPVPPVLEAANVDGEGGINVADLTYLVDYIFFEGPELICDPIE